MCLTFEFSVVDPRLWSESGSGLGKFSDPNSDPESIEPSFSNEKFCTKSCFNVRSRSSIVAQKILNEGNDGNHINNLYCVCENLDFFIFRIRIPIWLRVRCGKKFRIRTTSLHLILLVLEHYMRFHDVICTSDGHFAIGMGYWRSGFVKPLLNHLLVKYSICYSEH